MVWLLDGALMMRSLQSGHEVHLNVFTMDQHEATPRPFS